MSTALGLLVITLLTSGGPRTAKPQRIDSGIIMVRRGGHVVAKSTNGALKVHLRNGSYSVKTRAPYISNAVPSSCEHSTVRVRAGHTTRIKLYCNIP